MAFSFSTVCFNVQKCFIIELKKFFDSLIHTYNELWSFSHMPSYIPFPFPLPSKLFSFPTSPCQFQALSSSSFFGSLSLTGISYTSIGEGVLYRGTDNLPKVQYWRKWSSLPYLVTISCQWIPQEGAGLHEHLPHDEMLPGPVLDAQKFLVLIKPSLSFVVAAATYPFAVISSPPLLDPKVWKFHSCFLLIILSF